jgi:hypothetical protein
MNQYRRLGQLTAAKTAAEKKANIFRALGGGLDKAVGMGAKALGKGLTRSPGSAALTLGGVGLGASAINEGLGYHGMNPFEVDNDSLWSPQSQAVRNEVSGGGLGRVREFFKRPIQSMMTNGQLTNNHNDYFRRNPRLPQDVIKGWKRGPDGRMQMQLSGTVDAPFESSYLELLNKYRSMQGMPGMLDRQTGTAGEPDKGTVKYIFGHPALPGSSNS